VPVGCMAAAAVIRRDTTRKTAGGEAMVLQGWCSKEATLWRRQEETLGRRRSKSIESWVPSGKSVWDPGSLQPFIIIFQINIWKFKKKTTWMYSTTYIMSV
jgi:hypothetical protein